VVQAGDELADRSRTGLVVVVIVVAIIVKILWFVGISTIGVVSVTMELVFDGFGNGGAEHSNEAKAKLALKMQQSIRQFANPFRQDSSHGSGQHA
jgi:cellobiose-specific phosphotransferase system component IIC